jgi:hypothetical protein
LPKIAADKIPDVDAILCHIRLVEPEILAKVLLLLHGALRRQKVADRIAGQADEAED